MATLQKKSAAIQKLQRRLAKASGLAELRLIHARANVLRLEAKAKADSKTIRLAAEICLCADRELGQLLGTVVRHGGDRKSADHDQSSSPALESLGVSRIQSSRWQREASVPDRRFRQYLRAAAREGCEPTANGLLRLAAAKSTKTATGAFAETAAALRSLASRGKRFACILAVPPAESLSSNLLRSLARLPVAAVAARKSHLHLWVAPNAVEDGLRLLKAWGFKYAASLAWQTQTTDCGDYWRDAHCYLLLGVRDDLAFCDNRVPSLVDGRTAKPGALRRLVELVSPGPRLDLFGTEAAASWTVLARRRVAPK